MKIHVLALTVILCAGSTPLCGIPYEKEKKPPRVNINDPAGPPKSGSAGCEDDFELRGEVRGIDLDRRTIQIRDSDKEVTLTVNERTILEPEGISLRDFGVGDRVVACYRSLSTAKIAAKIYKVE